VTEPLRLLDTSIIVRYLSNDLPELARRARQLIESDAPLGIATVAVLEAAHVLRHPPYGYTREAVVDALVRLIRRDNIHGVGVDTAHVALALLLCRPSSTVSFGDALIAATGRSAAVEEICTFDARFGRAGLRPVAVPDIPTPPERSSPP
jgi:predicted nucleic acid-binding protein